ncbi:MAG: Peptidoglycan-binding domain 1 protein, partial [Solirubrobacterales bacterium]|nr:Peptidoglycan-binding domain 1 protein [Solirubrobacterales bacterium]
MSDTDAPLGPGRARRRRGIAAAALALAGIVVAAIVAMSGSGGAAGAADSPSISPATTQIKRQDLVETDTEDGKLGYADARDVVNHLSGVVTWIPSVGAVVGVDQPLYRVDGAPVILLDGTSPAFRDLSSSTPSGHDITELERNLRRLGYDDGHAMTVDGTWDSGTTAAVDRWQDTHGLTQTGSIALGRVVFLPGARRIESVDATLGGSTTGGGSGSGAAGGSAQTASASAGDLAAAHTVFVDDPTTTATTTTETTPTTSTPTPTTTTPPTVTTTTPQAPATPSRTTTTPAAPETPAAPAASGRS